MPLELAMPLFLPNEDFRNRKTPKFKGPLRPCLLKQLLPEELPEVNEVSAPASANGKAKKQVTFADHKGLALTMVKMYSEFDDLIDIPLNIQELFKSSLTLLEEESKLTLNFAQPSADYLLFRQRLESDKVCLEHCMLKDKAMTGTVKVKNLSFEKSVKVRVTFDTWKSYTDVECQYVKDTYMGSDRDTFSFEVNLPEQVPPHERIEFAVCYEANGVTHWDSNQGQNYRIIHSALKTCLQSDHSVGSQRNSSGDWGIHLDRYGSPRCSHGIFPEWPSYTAYEDIGPYY
ncbi:protein phosphatase 1 regulatory subunit 3B [Chanos chanos]|uniref:Protein phosphatase 1 regulatory subunit n=1 Tax=Chanos chanos TaxID=29144 RepID=A0A6J2USP3_CHACN|nr:protein phosphatase 1 regulatory subunit 3B [Chanos chanos]XP_030623063.1 protein phosphatase 1 regulatory subunit 3B [Chanos chanos]XP_030623064.1 protein phosphatase 1 regulatory subunit 3B [Chanos chanos]XP_030623065.1 protein phosphatase 1 regulatory subunit 3B [Chanos chanos]XP_030623066.1 protein phosphatase 1 regulatory subunit 3B [Chanos chanos]